MSADVALQRQADIAIVGCGAMGAGIAQVALLAGHRVLLRDLDASLAESARASVLSSVDRLVAKGRLDPESIESLGTRLVVAGDTRELAKAALVIEAVAEALNVKRAVLTELEGVVGERCILASNTSSLSLEEIASGMTRPDRFVGMHFFNPAAVMRLVEVVRGSATSPDTVATCVATAEAWGKTPIVVSDSPGFVVNRVARPFYGETLRLLDEGFLQPATIDLLLRAAGFPMGPCELMDLIGHDVSSAANRSVWEGAGYDARYRPSETQQRLVTSGHLGRKTGRGFYIYPVEGAADPVPAADLGEGRDVARDIAAVRGAGLLAAAASATTGSAPAPSPVEEIRLACGGLIRLTDGLLAVEHTDQAGAPVLLVDRWAPGPDPLPVAVGVPDDCPDHVLSAAIRVLHAIGLDPVCVPDVPGLVVSRVVSLLVDEANDLVGRGVASAHDVDVAMQLGTRYPRGPLSWGDDWGATDVVAILDNLRNRSGDPRYRVSTRLRSRAFARRPLADE